MERPVIKDKNALAYVEYLESQLADIKSSPYVDSYEALKKVVDSWNKKIKDLTEIDTDSADAKAIIKYLSVQKTYLEQLEYFKSKMSPDDRKAIEKKMRESAGIAERMALEERDGKDRGTV